MNQEVIDQAHEYWMADNRPLELGRVLYDNLPTEQRPLWAASILRLVYSRVRLVPEIDKLLDITEDPSRWNEALEVLDGLRGITLLDRNALHHEVIDLAQKVAKITHNASGQSDPFPQDIGYRMIIDLHQIVNLVNNDNFTTHVWEILIAPFKA